MSVIVVVTFFHVNRQIKVVQKFPWSSLEFTQEIEHIQQIIQKIICNNHFETNIVLGNKLTRTAIPTLNIPGKFHINITMQIKFSFIFSLRLSVEWSNLLYPPKWKILLSCVA